MQFHLNGFKPGDPQISEPAEPYASQPSAALPKEVDVPIVGCGPTGMALAAQPAAFSDIRTRIVEQKSGPLFLGQADGVTCRTMEMCEAFGFSEAGAQRGLLGQRDRLLEAGRRRPGHDRLQQQDEGHRRASSRT
jgi:2-polyprenyl-6-methoxyphenol hydroxylase-like FAD-dependent oxidoreductase